jgi:hypothetical protein
VHIIYAICFAWILMALVPYVPHVQEQQVIIAVNPQDSECYVWIPPGTFQMGYSPDDRVCQNRPE